MIPQVEAFPEPIRYWEKIPDNRLIEQSEFDAKYNIETVHSDMWVFPLDSFARWSLTGLGKTFHDPHLKLRALSFLIKFHSFPAARKHFTPFYFSAFRSLYENNFMILAVIILRYFHKSQHLNCFRIFVSATNPPWDWISRKSVLRTMANIIASAKMRWASLEQFFICRVMFSHFRLQLFFSAFCCCVTMTRRRAMNWFPNFSTERNPYIMRGLPDSSSNPVVFGARPPEKESFEDICGPPQTCPECPEPRWV